MEGSHGDVESERSTPGINILSQVAAKAALETKKEWMPGVVRQSRRNQELIKAAVKTSGCTLPVSPSMANLFVVDVTSTGLDPSVIEERLLFDHKVFVRGGGYLSPRFGDRFVRISFSVPGADVRRFAEAWPVCLAQLQKK